MILLAIIIQKDHDYVKKTILKTLSIALISSYLSAGQTLLASNETALMTNEDNFMALSLIRGKLYELEQTGEISLKDCPITRERIANIAKSQNDSAKFEAAIDLGNYLKKPKIEQGTTHFIQTHLEKMYSDLLRAQAYNNALFSEKVAFLDLMSDNNYNTQQQVVAFKAWQELEATDARQAHAWKERMLAEKTGAVEAIGRIYRTLPPEDRDNEDLSIILNTLKTNDDLKKYTGIQILSAFLNIRDGGWEKED